MLGIFQDTLGNIVGKQIVSHVDTSSSELTYENVDQPFLPSLYIPDVKKTQTRHSLCLNIFQSLQICERKYAFPPFK